MRDALEVGAFPCATGVEGLPDLLAPSLLTGTSAKRQGGIAVALNSFLDPLGSSVFPHGPL